ncbi:MAG: aspartate carbamoyltransferase regulatory subunit [Clostridiales bacterium]|nr:aspartate carbamoyltransferase regulatory subunit [Clostridiales bacterium]
MIIGKIENGIVLDHIKAGHGMELYKILGLDKVNDCQVALIKNAESEKMGRKDIIKIDKRMDINLDAIGYVDPGITINFIENGKLAKRTHIDPPEKIVDVIRCKNPRCITTVEQEIPHIFRLTDKANGIYRCIYCESKAK